MRTRALLFAVLLLAGSIPVPASGQDTSEVRLTITFELNPSGTVDVTFQVDDPGPLETLSLKLGEMEALEPNSTEFDGAWRTEKGKAVVDLTETPQATASWTNDGRVQAQTLEGTGHTTYVGDDFAVLKAGDMVPNIGYSFRGSEPAFQTILQTRTPDGWTVDGPWPSADGGFQLDRPLPRGFLAAGPNVERVELGNGESSYQIVRVAGAQEDAETEQLLLEARDYLGGLYGKTAQQQFIVVAPDPMFRGGLGSPAGVFLHGEANADVVAHEMVHTYQGFRFSRAPGEATVWLGDGTAVVHGVLLEVAAGLTERQEARQRLESQAEEAQEKHAVDLTSAVYGSGNERAAYTKGAVVVTALDDRIREGTGNQYTLSDVLRELNRRGQESDSFKVSTGELVGIIEETTEYNATDFFEEYVYGPSIPPLGSIFPGEASVRITGTEPSPPVAGKSFRVTAQITNLDTKETTVEAPVLVNGTERGNLVATLAAGATAQAEAEVEPLERGTYEISIESATATITVESPAQPSANVTLWPPSPASDENVTVGARVSNAGEAPFKDTIRVELDGRSILEERVRVPAGEVQTVSDTLPPLDAGTHLVRVSTSEGEVLAEKSFPVTEPIEQAHAPGPAALVVVTLIGLAARLGRARARR